MNTVLIRFHNVKDINYIANGNVMLAIHKSWKGEHPVAFLGDVAFLVHM
jgi:hypothetical protein